MSDVELEDKEEIETPEPVEDKPAPDAKKTITRDDWERVQESKAHAKGWRPFDEFVANGGDPENWRTADAFLTYRELTGEIVKQRQDFNQRLEGVHKLSQAQLNAERNRLIKERDDAIEAGQKKEVHALDKQINELNQAPPVQAGDPIIDRWNRDNQWILEKTPKAAFAYSIWPEIMANSRDSVQALAKLESEIKKHYPPPKSPTTNLPESEKGHGNKGFGNRKAALTMNDLTSNERNIYNALPGAWKNEAEFLQAVADDRKAAAKG